MLRQLTWIAAVLVALSTSTRAQSAKPKDAAKADAAAKLEARHQYHAAQAALYSAMAHATALENFSATAGGEMDLARSYVHTINRDAQACDGDSVKVGQAIHAAEKHESMKELRKELAEAMKALDEAQNAVDGHGGLGPHAKNANAHLQMAFLALLKLGDAIGVKPLPSPGAMILKDADAR